MFINKEVGQQILRYRVHLHHVGELFTGRILINILWCEAKTKSLSKTCFNGTVSNQFLSFHKSSLCQKICSRDERLSTTILHNQNRV